MSVIMEESDTPFDLETLAGHDNDDREEKLCLPDVIVKPIDPNLPIRPLSQNEGHNASCVGSTVPDLSNVTVKLEIENSDEKGCNITNHNASEPSPSIPSYSGERADEFKFSNRNSLDSITIGQHKPISPIRKTIDEEDWIKKEPYSSTDFSSTLSEDTIVIHSKIDDLVSGNEDLVNDIAGKPLYSNNTPTMDSYIKRVKHEPTEVFLAEQQSRCNKSTVEEKQIAEIMSGKHINTVTIQRLQSHLTWRRNSCKNNGKSCNSKKTLPNIDPDTSTSSQGQKGKFVCRTCLENYVLCSALKKHMIQKHPESRDLCALMKKDSTDLDNDYQLVWFCPRNCEYLTSKYNSLSEHLVTCQCQKPDSLPRCNRIDKLEIGNNLSLFGFDEDYCGNATAEELNVHTQQTVQASRIPGQALEHEMQSVEQDIDDVPTCQWCESVYSTNMLLEGHMKDCYKEQLRRTHTGDNPYTCIHCNKTLSNIDDLHRHMKIHTGEKRHKCNYCDKSFTTNSHLHEHIRIHTGEKPYNCNQCDKSFNRKYPLRVHMRTHTGEKPFKCSHCNKTFGERKYLLQHTMKKHKGEKPYNCSHCDKSFITNNCLHVHMRTHTGDKLYRCSHCSKSFGERTYLLRHMKIHTGERPYRCNHCDKSFSSNNDLLVHMRTHTGEKPFKCSHCSKSFSQNGHLRLHTTTHTGEKRFKCNHCSKSFCQNVHLLQHTKTHTGEKAHKCNYCDKSFTTNSHLHEHIRIHTGEKPYKCNQCDKSFNRKYPLHVHMRTHTGEKPFKCSHCNKSFGERKHLLQHMKIHAGERPYRCNHCGKSFITNRHLRVHMRTHTGEKPFKCSHCSKSFGGRAYLLQHMKIHTGERPYRCNHCGKSFITNSHLLVHMRTHTGEKPFKCSHCSKSFSQNGHLRQHAKTHTGEKPFKCSHCSKSFCQNGHLLQHMKTHIGEKAYKYNNCDKSFRSNSHLHVHMGTHTGEKPFKCSHCDKSFTRHYRLHVHMRTHRGEKQLKCSHCSIFFSLEIGRMNFITKSDLHTHENTNRRKTIQM